MAFQVAYEPKKRHWWDFRRKQWFSVTHRVKKPECSFCGYKFKKEEIIQKPTISKDEVRAENIKKSRRTFVRRGKPKWHS
jgi:hypothetical protein